MKYGKSLTLILLAALLSGEALAAQDSEAEARQRDEQQRAEERLRAEQQREAERLQENQVRDRERAVREVAVERRRVEAEMRRAEARMEEAARRIAELSTRQLPNGQSWAFVSADRPALGITISGDSESGPVEGVAINGITPGGAAAAAGLRAGDVITSIDGEALAADSSDAANKRLLGFMSNVEAGSSLSLEYLRDGDVASVELEPRVPEERAFSFAFRTAPGAPGAPSPMPAPRPFAPPMHDFHFWMGSGGWADMEMVTLTEQLGRYFGTDSGLLVIRAPEDSALQLQDGDVIRSVDGREPESIAHLLRILGSYQPGESLELEIMRDKRRRTLEIEIPDNRQGSRWPVASPAPAPAVIVDVQRKTVTN